MRAGARLAAAITSAATALSSPVGAVNLSEFPGPLPQVAIALQDSDRQPVDTGRPDVNPYDRDLALTAPLLFGRRMLGEIPVVLTADDRVLIETEAFLTLVRDVVNPAALSDISALVSALPRFESSQIAPAGVSLEYDPSTLSVAILKIDAARRLEAALFEVPRPDKEQSAQPEAFSAYLNLDLFGSMSSESDFSPGGLVSGAVRFGGVVFEAEGSGGEGVAGDTEFTRRYARLVYDQPEDFRRWYLGDLDPELRGRQDYVPLGGVGVSRQRRRFNAFRSDILRGSRQLLLEQDSTVTILRNGVPYRELQLDAGPYDISSLPLLTGSNDVEIRIRDLAGRTQLVNYSAYLDPIDLEPGDYEYAAFLGIQSEDLFGSPQYNGDLAFTGFYRKAFVDRPALGVGVQASERVQMGYAETQFVLRNGSRLQLNAAASTGDAGTGYAGGAGFDQYFDRAGQTDVLSIQADYTSRSFGSLSNFGFTNSTTWSLTAQYTRIFSERLFGSASANYQSYRTGLEASWRVNTSLNYRVNREVRVSAGVDYGRSAFRSDDQDEVGVRFALSWQPDFSRRAEATYESRTNSASLSYLKSGDGRVGSVSYGAFTGYDNGPASVSAFGDYVGNRGTVSVTHGYSGNDFNSVTDQSRTSISLGTSIATTGGKLAIGRRINNSFAIVAGHPSLRGRSVRIGDSFEDGRYLASSGPMGPALFSYLTPFVDQSIRYDVPDAPRGYDIGQGVKRLRPTHRSGFALTVGTDAFITAYGTLRNTAGEPISLIVGDLVAPSRPDDAPARVFTNTAGRFALAGLRPGERYSVTLRNEARSRFEFEVPKDNEGLLNLHIVTVEE